MKHLLAVALLAGVLAGCQGLLGANGQITGFTVPPGCKGSFTFTWPMPQGSIMGSCDETGAVAVTTPPSTDMMAHAAVAMPAAGAHVTIDRQ